LEYDVLKVPETRPLIAVAKEQPRSKSISRKLELIRKVMQMNQLDATMIY